MKTELKTSDDEVIFEDMNSIINYIKENYVKIFLLLLVPIIVYVVDHINNYNTIIMTPLVVPNIPNVQGYSEKKNIKNKKIKTRKNIKK